MKDFEELRRLEKEKKEFEDELELKMLSNSVNLDEKKSFMPYQNSSKKLINSLLISLVITLIIGLGGWMYSKEHFTSLSSDNVDKIHNAIQFSVTEYYQDNKSYPVDIHGNIDFVTLKKRGYLTLDIEAYKSKFKYDNNHNVIRLE
jgi:hypothetical protein